MTDKLSKPYGTWPSPITAALLSASLQIPEAAWSADGRRLVWLEEHSGQGILFASALDGNDPRRLTGEQSVRAAIGYGGGNFAVGTDRVYYIQTDGRLYAQTLAHGEPRPLTHPGMLCSSPAASPDGRWIAFVYDVDGRAGVGLADALGRQWPVKIAEETDFVMQPAWHPDQSALVWIGWNHPAMPWDGAQLYRVALHNGAGPPQPAGEPAVVAGGEEESVLQPEFSPDGQRLAYISDAAGWYQLYACGADGEGERVRLTDEEAEFGGAAWQMGMRWYGWMPDSASLAATRNHEGEVRLVRVDAAGGGVTEIKAHGTDYSTLTRPVVNPADGRIAAMGAAPGSPPRLVVLGAGGPPRAEGPRIVRRTAAEQHDPQTFSNLRHITWHDGSGREVHGLFAAPASARYESAGLPPLVVTIHGGPTSQAYRTWRPDLQFFTSRGYACLEVNHRGSTGYGRAFREQLRENWGVADVEDAVSGLEYVAAQGWADGKRCAIKGSSAGGYTVLRALTEYPTVFGAAVCLYGISDLFALARETHKFEAYYLDTLVGRLPESSPRYRERSPLFHAERIQTPVIFFQGDQDRVVSPGQSERIVASLKSRGIPHEFHLYPGEGHGFRREETIRAYLEATERFLLTYLVYS